MAQNKPSAEEIFRKNSEEMSDMERMMADILREKEVLSEEEDVEEAVSDNIDDIIDEVYSAPAAPAPPSRKNRAPQTDGTPKARSVSYDPDFRADNSASAYSQTLKSEREKKIAKESKKRGMRPSAIILILCAAIVIGAILFKALSEDFAASMPGAQNEKTEIIPLDSVSGDSDSEDPDNTLPPDIYIPTPDPEGENIKIAQPGTIVIMSDTKESGEAAGETESGQPVPLRTGTHSYELFVEDVSWTQAQQRCAELGGHLVNISDEAELNEIIALAQEKGIEKLWIGCHRENAQLIWENDEQISYYKWGKGEPSGYDSGDRVTEDYVLLWKFGGDWVYNDSRDNPVKDYPDMYSGQIGFVCEYEAEGTTPAAPVNDNTANSNFTEIQPDIPG
ncbi:MAG: C-type lectin domain-containing protein [Eubacteriales bacterium]|nr:C-type lectin domain-containing protein [Eubacteriales bacterium]